MCLSRPPLLQQVAFERPLLPYPSPLPRFRPRPRTTAPPLPPTFYPPPPSPRQLRRMASFSFSPLPLPSPRGPPLAPMNVRRARSPSPLRRPAIPEAFYLTPPPLLVGSLPPPMRPRPLSRPPHEYAPAYTRGSHESPYPEFEHRPRSPGPTGNFPHRPAPWSHLPYPSPPPSPTPAHGPVLLSPPHTRRWPPPLSEIDSRAHDFPPGPLSNSDSDAYDVAMELEAHDAVAERRRQDRRSSSRPPRTASPPPPLRQRSSSFPANRQYRPDLSRTPSGTPPQSGRYVDDYRDHLYHYPSPPPSRSSPYQYPHARAEPRARPPLRSRRESGMEMRLATADWEWSRYDHPGW